MKENYMQNPFEVLFKKLESMETTMQELKSKLNKFEGGLPSPNEAATRIDAAKYLGVSVGTIDNLVRSKQLKPFRLGSSVRFTYKELDDFIEKKKNG